MTDPLAGGNEADTSQIDLHPVAQCLTGGTTAAVNEAWPAAKKLLEELFDAETWGMNHDVNEYGPGAHANLYNVECQRDFRTWLSEKGVSMEDYGQAVGDIQHVAIQVYLLSLLERGRSNKGWRIRLVGFPALKIVAFGLSSHYQGTQNQNQMGSASRLIRAQALDILPAELQQVLQEFRSATAQDWEERGLMPTPVLAIGNLDISDYDERGGAKLRMVRNTTLKKELSTFFALKGMSIEKFQAEGLVELQKLRDIALALGRDEAGT